MIRVLLVDDHPALRHGVRRALDAAPTLSVVGEAQTAADALCQARHLRPDLTVVDVSLPDRCGIELARDLLPYRTRVLVYSATASLPFVQAARDAGAHGYLAKDEPVPRLLEAAHAVARGGTHWPTPSAPHHDPAAALSPREHQILTLLAQGLSPAAIALSLFISEGTVRNTLSAVYAQIGASGAREAIVWAWAHRLVRPESVAYAGH